MLFSQPAAEMLGCMSGRLNKGQSEGCVSAQTDPHLPPHILRLAAAPPLPWLPDRATGQSWSLSPRSRSDLCLDLGSPLDHSLLPRPLPHRRSPRSLPRPSPRDEHRRVMVGHAVLRNGIAMAAAVHDGLLPLTKAVQGLPGVVGDLQGGLRMDTVRYAGTSHPGATRAVLSSVVVEGGGTSPSPAPGPP